MIRKVSCWYASFCAVPPSDTIQHNGSEERSVYVHKERELHVPADLVGQAVCVLERDRERLDERDLGPQDVNQRDELRAQEVGHDALDLHQAALLVTLSSM